MQRPTSATVFGILNIIFGGLGLIGTAFSWKVRQLDEAGANPVLELAEASDVFSSWMQLATYLGLVASIVAIACGIGLLRMGRWARITSVGYGLYSIVATLVGFAMSWFYIYSPMLDMLRAMQDPTQKGIMIGSLIGGVLGGCFGLIYPAVLLYFMTRPGLVAAFEGTPLPELSPPPFAAPDPPPGFDASDPYRPPATSLRTAYEAPPSSGDEMLATVIPFRNKPALISYYLGVFSLAALVPLLGVVGVGMAIAAFVLGIKGRRLAREQPEAKGIVHAWVGIVGGAVWGLLGILVQGAIVFAIIAR